MLVKFVIRLKETIKKITTTIPKRRELQQKLVLRNNTFPLIKPIKYFLNLLETK